MTTLLRIVEIFNEIRKIFEQVFLQNWEAKLAETFCVVSLNKNRVEFERIEEIDFLGTAKNLVAEFDDPFVGGLEKSEGFFDVEVADKVEKVNFPF